jgi:hypothetical protein
MYVFRYVSGIYLIAYYFHVSLESFSTSLLWPCLHVPNPTQDLIAMPICQVSAILNSPLSLGEEYNVSVSLFLLEFL